MVVQFWRLNAGRSPVAAIKAQNQIGVAAGRNNGEVIRSDFFEIAVRIANENAKLKKLLADQMPGAAPKELLSKNGRARRRTLVAP
ncbi:hypothetical protein [Mesorhizobium dulcispinae]|uniref:hypothetical protein n=1 Tax=Mesorhizobium dulcispinae TaxID=3072316 RepID=UPI002A24560F|nr:hypothetical protein [Mesorhizobium sp. VK23D]MDX8518319.1 hypothetical protein [Mesorhizobium sp. VK23D]